MALTDFSGITAVITGAASGIGLATAQALYAQGACVVLADVNAEGLQAARESLQQHLPAASGQVLCLPTDVRYEQEVQKLMQTALTVCQRIDLVVTCAGVGDGGPIDTFAASQMQRMMDINFMGTFHCIQQALPAMQRQGAGHFVCLSSVAGKLGNPFLSGYCASKWAVRGFTSALRAELEGSGIGITTVYPAWVDTPMVRQGPDPVLGRNVPVLLSAPQVASAILQAVKAEQRDLTLVPNPEIQRALQLYAADQEKAERAMGRNAQLARAARQSEQTE
ncbi:MAG TPA: SDR family oxidoreductase [Ktedonobacteraceae bacterium]|jgi:NAD(P)-dependent dehydrogenase (short-subunit alcohol dehydrogenase family)